MNRFFGRQRELRELNELIGQRAQLVVVYGRRRVGKTTLLLQWARQAARGIRYVALRARDAG